MSVAESVDDGWEEVLKCLREQRQVLEEKEDVDTVVPESKFQSSDKRDIVSIVGFFRVVDKAPFSKGSLLISKPL